MRRIQQYVFAAFLGSLAILLSQASWAQRREPPTGLVIEGYVQVLGCPVRPSDITVYAQLLTPAAARDIRPTEPLVASGERTGDDRTAHFSFRGLQAGGLYQLRIAAHPPNPCGRIRWQGPKRGLVPAGQRTVRIFGYVLQSELDVLGTAASGRARGSWVGADNLDLADVSNTTRTFRWRTRIAGVVGGILQVATEPFPLGGESRAGCSQPPGLVHSARFAAQTGEWSSPPPVNFTSVAAQFTGGSRLRPMLMRSLSLGAPWYVRVVPVTATGPVCDSMETGPAPSVILANTSGVGSIAGALPGLGNGQVQLLSQSTFQQSWFWPYHPTYYETGFRVIKLHFLNPFNLNTSGDFYGYLAYGWALGQPSPPWTGGSTLQPGDRFFYYNSSSGGGLGDFIDSFVSVVSGIVDAIGSVADWLSKAYADIQQAVVQVVSTAITMTGLYNCNASPDCQKLVRLGLQTGLQAMGLPPSLPNWNDVVNGGYQYLAAELVSDAGVSNIPGAQDLTEAGAKALVEKSMAMINDNRGFSGGTTVDWLIEDLAEEPAVIRLELATSSQGQQLPDKLQIYGNAVFHGAAVPLPEQWPSDPVNPNRKRLTIPVVLQPNMDGFVSSWSGGYPEAVDAKAYYFQTKLPGYSCATFHGVLFKTPGGNLNIPVASVPPFSVFTVASSHTTRPNGDVPVRATTPLLMPALSGCAQ